MAYFEYENYKIYYKECGEGTPLILIHGDTASSKMFGSELKFYAKYFRVITLDLAGQGKSQRMIELPSDYWHYNGMMIIALCRKLGISHVNLIGTSGGAIAAINAVLEEPCLFNKIVLDSFLGEQMSCELAESIISERELSKHRFTSKLFWFMMHGHDWKYVVDQNTDCIKKFSLGTGCFYKDDISSIKNQVMITGSRKDNLIPNIEERLKDINLKLQNSKLVLFEQGGHPAMFSNSKEFRKLVLDFLI